MRNATRAVLGVMLVPAVVSVAGAQEMVREVTLEEALAMAERNNPSLEQSASSVEIAQHQELSAWGQFLPNLDLRYQFSDASTGRLDPTGQDFATTSYSAQLGGSIDRRRATAPSWGEASICSADSGGSRT
jgi:outer membrane protein TolC